MDLTAVESRLQELRAEMALGQRTLQEMETRRQELTATLLRISGAIQVLEDLLRTAADGPQGATPWATSA